LGIVAIGVVFAFLRIPAMTTEPSRLALIAICRAGQVIAFLTIAMPTC
jgi:hypothetical protein